MTIPHSSEFAHLCVQVYLNQGCIALVMMKPHFKGKTASLIHPSCIIVKYSACGEENTRSLMSGHGLWHLRTSQCTMVCCYPNTLEIHRVPLYPYTLENHSTTSYQVHSRNAWASSCSYVEVSKDFMSKCSLPFPLGDPFRFARQ